MRDLFRPGRSPARATNAMAATSHGLATATALQVLQAGGNAVDAAISACAVQSVVEPQSVGIGGDCFALIKPAGRDEVIAYNGSGRAPAAARQDWYAKHDYDRVPRLSPHSVTVPGAVEAWCRLLQDQGSWSLNKILAPAIGYARHGAPVGERVAFDWAREVDNLARFPATAEVFLPGGKAPAPGDIFRQPALATTLETIAAKGPAGFYQGPVAEEMVALLQAEGGLHSAEDFAAVAGGYVTPIVGSYRGLEVYQCPPNGQGVAALQLLALMERAAPDPEGPLGLARLHRFIEATRLAYDTRDRFLGDPDHDPVPEAAFLHPRLVEELSGRIDPERTMGPLPVPPGAAHSDTVYITVVDRAGCMVSLICPLFDSFGSCLLAPKSGVLLQSRGASFSLAAGHPNTIAPGKRPLHTIIPGMVARDGRPFLSYGVMGGHYQAAGHAWFLGNLFDHGMDPQAAIDLPRLFAWPGGPVDVESGVPEDKRAGLIALGHEVAMPKKPIGGGQAILVDWEAGSLTGGSDPRKDGAALGY